MPRTGSHPEEAVRHALEVLVTSTPAELDRAFASAPSRLGNAAAAMRTALAYQQSVDELESALGALPTTVDPSTARAAQATENVWRQLETEFGLLSSSEVSALLGARSANRAYAAGLRKRGELLAARRRNAYVFPGFQFDRKAGAVLPWVAPLLRLAQAHERTAVDVTQWMMSPTTYFGGRRPADHLAEPERLLDVAERAWGIEW